MATSGATVWSKGFSENPGGEPLGERSLVELLARVGDEMVAAPGDAGAELRISRRELLARVLWTRAILDADNAAAKLIIEYLDGKPGDAGSAGGEPVEMTADDLALAEALLRGAADLQF